MNIIKKARKEKGLTRRYMAKKLHVFLFLYIIYEKNTRYITVEMMKKILDLLEIKYH